MISTKIFNGKKNERTVQTTETEKIPETSLDEIPPKILPEIFSKIPPKPTKTGIKKIREKKIYTIKKMV